MLRFLLLFLVAAFPAFGQMQPWQPVVLAPVTASSYTGPGDIVSGAFLWVSCTRGYNAAYATGSNNGCNYRRASDNSTQNGVILANGNFDVASYNSFVGTDATASCTLAGTSAACSGASATIHVGDPISGVGISQPCVVTATNGSTTATVVLAGTSNSCGTVGVAETFTFQVAGFITKAYDQSGNGLDLPQVTAGKQPQIFPNCVNGVPCLLWVPGNSTNLGPATVPNQSTYTYSVVINALSLTSCECEIISTFTTTGGLFNIVAGPLIEVYNNTYLTASITLGAWHAAQAISNTISSNMKVDGTDSTGTTGAGTSGTTLNWGSFSGTRIFNGYEAEGGFWPAFSSGQANSMHTNQSAFYGTP